jgi:PAS domain S-box-containing protein
MPDRVPQIVGRARRRATAVVILLPLVVATLVGALVLLPGAAGSSAPPPGMVVAAIGALLAAAAGAVFVRRELRDVAAAWEKGTSAFRAPVADLTRAADAAAVAIVQVDPVTHRLLHANAAAASLTGLPMDALLTKRLTDLLPRDAREGELARWQQLAEGAIDAFQAETRVVRADGASRSVLMQVAQMPAQDGAGPRAVACLTDVTDRARTELAVRESERRARQLIEHVPALLWSGAPGGGADYVGPQWFAYTGRPAAELLGEGWMDALHPDDREPVRALCAAVGEPTVRRADCRLRGRGDAHRWFELQIVPIGAMGSAQRWLGAAFDIDDRRRALDASATQRSTIEQRGSEREAAWADALRDLEAFTYAMSHDLRAPLRRIGGFAALVSDAVTPAGGDKVRHYCARMADETERAGRLIDALLAFARIGRAPIRPERIDLSQLVHAVRAELRDGDAGAIEWQIDALPEVVADPVLLRTVWAELLSNALKYTAPQPQPRIHIGARARGADTVCFVADNGVGFDMRFAGQLFGILQRLHLGDEFPGSGMGLATVRRIVARHGGETWAEAEPGRGATIYFSLPHHPSGAAHA